MKTNWSEKVTWLSRKILAERRLNQIEMLSQSEDLEKLSKFLQEKLTVADLTVEKATWDNYRDIMQYIESRLMVYNKRRSGELGA